MEQLQKAADITPAIKRTIQAVAKDHNVYILWLLNPALLAPSTETPGYIRYLGERPEKGDREEKESVPL